MRCGVQLGTVVPVTLVYQAVPQNLEPPTKASKETEADNSRANFVYKVYSEMNLSTASELTSSSQFEFLSSTDPSEAGLSEREVRKRTDLELMAPIPGPDSQLQEVKNLWGASACESLGNILNEFDDLFVKFEACVVVDVFPPGLCLGPQELKCYNINHQEPTGEARIDERASLVVSFVVPHAALIPLRGLVDTGSGVSILTFSAFNRVAARTGTVLKPYQVDLYAANGKTIKTFGLAEQIRFQLGGYELETNFVVVDDEKGVEDFLLGRNFLRSCQVLVDLTSMKIVLRAPVKPVWHHAHAQVGDTSLATPVALDSDLVLQFFERTVARAKLSTDSLEPLIFQTVALNASFSDPLLQNVVFLEDSVATVSETGTLYVSLINLTSNP